MKAEWVQYEPVPAPPLFTNLRWGKVLMLPVGWAKAAYKWFTSGAPGQVSPAKLLDYYNCPQKYKYVRVDKKPQRPSPHLSFYKALHGAIVEFHKTLQSNPTAAANDLLAQYQSLWDPDGFANPEEEKLFYDRGLQALERYFALHHGKKPPDELRVPVEVEISGIPMKTTVDAVEKITPFSDFAADDLVPDAFKKELKAQRPVDGRMRTALGASADALEALSPDPLVSALNALLVSPDLHAHVDAGSLKVPRDIAPLLAEARALAADGKVPEETRLRTLNKWLLWSSYRRGLRKTEHWRLTFFKTGQRVLSEASLTADLKSQMVYLMVRTKWPKVRLDAQYYYLIADIRVAFKMKQEHMDDAREVIEEASRGIGSEEFEPKATHLCGWCDFQLLCPHWHGYVTDRKRFRLSYSKMSCYLNCPRNYKFIYVDRVAPQPRNFFSIGTSLHNTMEEFYMYDGIFKQPSFDYLVKLFVDNWLTAGYKDDADEKKFFESGMKQIRQYYISEVNGKFRKAWAVEPFFELPVGEKAVMVGFQDRIQKNDDGTYEVLDYKTEPKVRTQAEVDEDLQLTVYYWACLETFKITPARLTLLFTQFDQRVTTTRTPEHIPKLFDHVNKVVDTILNDKEFAPRINKYCTGCDHLKGCPKEQEILEGAKAGKFLHKIDPQDVKPAPPAGGPLEPDEEAEQEKQAEKNLSLLALEKDKEQPQPRG